MIAMIARMRTIAVLIVLVLAVQGVAINNLRSVQGETGWRIDAFTLKDPHNAKGANLPSDAFSPDEDIQIFAKLSYNEFPISHYLISFEISGPPNAVQNVTHLYTGQTNDSGMTQTPTFRETLFGEWTVLAIAQVGNGVTVNDSLAFRFDWIIRTTSLTTTDESFNNQTVFARGSNVMIEVTLLNIAMNDRNTTLSLEILDSLGLNINSAKTVVSVPANGTLTPYHFLLRIPENATNGVANIYVNAYKVAFDSGGIPYCPQISKSLLVMYRNIAIVQVNTSSSLVYKNESVSIDVKVRNDGDSAESFSVTVYRNETTIATMSVMNLPPSYESTLTAIWNTDQTEEGRYVIMANVTSILEGDDLSDNAATDGVVEVTQRIHDMEVTDVSPLSYAVYSGQLLEVNVVVKNKGTQAESTTIYLYYDDNVACTQSVSGIQAGNQQSAILRWDTTNVPEGNYTIRAFAAPVEGEGNIEDNTKIDGRVRIIASSVSGYFTFNWFDWFLLLLLLTMIILLLVMLYRQRQKGGREKNAKNSFDSGWAAWYYGYALQEKRPRKPFKRPPKGRQ